jgi:hypothetical protein
MPGRKKLQYAATTVSQSRCGAWAPTKRRKFWSYSETTPWATASVEGFCTQVHRSFVEFCLNEPRFDRKIYDDGSLGVIFTRRTVLTLMKITEPGKKGYARLETICEDLRVAKLNITKSDGTVVCDVTEGIISKYSHVRAIDRDGSMKYLGFGVRVSATYMQTFAQDVAAHTERHTKSIVAIPSGAVQAILRFLLTHESGYHGSFAIVAATVGLRGRDALKRARQDLIKLAAETAAMGVTYDASTKMLRYERQDDVWFSNPTKARQSRVSASQRAVEPVEAGGRTRVAALKGAVEPVEAGGRTRVAIETNRSTIESSSAAPRVGAAGSAK